MRIAYLIHWNEGPESGVFKKVVSQLGEWRRLGHDAALFVYTNNPSEHWGFHTGQVEAFIQRYDDWRSRFNQMRLLCRRLERWKPDVIYHRFDLYYPALHRLLRTVPSVLEINTNDLTEMQLTGGLRYWYHRLTRARLLRIGAGCIYVSRELSELEQYRKHVRHHTVIGNGFELAGVQPSSPPSNRSIRLIFIGSSGQSWQGVDKLIQLAELRESWLFDVIGIEAKELSGPTPGNMRFHGKLTRAEYEPLMRRADIAVGTLALHRKRMEEASPLKVREYLAYGIPVIMGYKETDFEQPPPFILELPNVADNIVPYLQQITAFAETWCGKRIERELVGHLDTKVKEAHRITFMSQVAKLSC
mgnify:CR=1 FL=1